MTDFVVVPIEKIKRKCLCCGDEMEIFPYEDKDFCDRCFAVICREFFNKANDGLTMEEFREKVRNEMRLEND